MLKLKIIKIVLIFFVIASINITAYYAYRILKDIDQISEKIIITSQIDYE